MRKNAIIGGLVCLAALSACSKHDPILPGVRTSIFDTTSVKMTDTKRVRTSIADITTGALFNFVTAFDIREF